jgi:glycosyltransferase involved in cell wall biosynthesis
MKINLIAPINTLGYGIVGHNILHQLVELKHDVAWWPIGPVEVVDQNSTKMYQKCIDNTAYYDSIAPSLKIWHQFDLAQHVGHGPHCAFPIFELNTLRDTEIHHLRQQDMIFVPSTWAAEVLMQYRDLADNILIVVAPLGVDTSIFKPSETVRPDPSWTTFLNCGKWEYRKGHDVLIEAFNRAFEPKDRVRLWMLSHNMHLTPSNNDGIDGNKEWETLYKSGPMKDKVSFLPRVQTHAEVARIMQEVDCGVFPSRAEGWNLEALEMMACEKDVILTDYSGHTEFASNENSYLVQVDEYEDAYDGKWFFGAEHGFGQWAEIGERQIEQLVEYMRYIHCMKNSEGSMGLIRKRAFADARQCSWTRTVEKIMGAISVFLIQL